MNLKLLTATALLSVASPAAADLILYEPFDYPVGNLAGNGGGVGFSGNWTIKSGAPQLTSPGLTYGRLQTSGNGSTSGATQSYRNFSNAGLTGDGATYWFSVLFAAPGGGAASTPTLPTFFADNSLLDAQKSGFAFKFDINSSTNATFDTRVNNSISAGVNVSNADWYADTHLVVGKIEFSGAAGEDRISIWLNPSLDAAPTDPPLSTHAGDWVDPGARNSFFYSRYNSPSRTIDEVRLGTTYADVVPVPEPTAALPLAAGLSAVAAALRRSRHARFGCDTASGR